METIELSSARKAQLVREYQAQTTGTGGWHKNWLGLVYTDGIKFVADVCEAHWLIDLVASHQPEIRKAHDELRTFQVWLIKPAEGDVQGGFIAEAWSDTPENSTLLARQLCEYTDFPPELMPFEFWVEGDVMLLKEEH